MLVRPTLTLTYAGARAALDAGLAEAARLEGRFNIAVVDSGANLLAFARMDGAFAESGPIAQDKARTVVRFNGIPSDDLYAALAGEPAVLTGISQRPGIAAFAGGVPITVDGELVGAVGASGGSAEQDKQVALAAALAVTASDAAPTEEVTP